MKKMLILLIIALMAVPAFASPLTATGVTPLSLPIPVKMLIDKTVTLSVDPPEILLTAVPGKVDQTYMGYTTVMMTHNFPVKVSANIAPLGVMIAPTLKDYECGLSDSLNALTESFAGAGPVKALLTYSTPAPGPTGRGFFVGAAIHNVNIDWVVSSATPQQVATVMLTVTDLL
jgi:hypothetical protein